MLQSQYVRTTAVSAVSCLPGSGEPAIPMHTNTTRRLRGWLKNKGMRDLTRCSLVP